MKTARNALKGYTYQNYVFTLLLAKMDTEQEIIKIISEATDTKNFDDAFVELVSGIQYRLQVKNYKDIKMKDIKVDSAMNVVRIKSDKNEYDPTDKNVVIINTAFKDLCNTVFLGIPALLVDGIIIVPLSEDDIGDMIEGMYQDECRALQIIQFGYKFTTTGIFEVERSNLPPIKTISTDLNQKTVIIRGVPEDFPNGITYIEGKPGIGKSHYVNEITAAYPNTVIYRFWTGSQDAELNSRLQFDVFLGQLGLLAFQSPKSFTIDELIKQLCHINKLIVIDGLDHVENYNPNELKKYIDYFEKLNEQPIRVIILSRPMQTTIAWSKRELQNWTCDESALYLATAYSITDYSIQKKIFDVSKGYPIITYFMAEHYLQYNELNCDMQIDSVYDYYNNLISDVRTKSVLGLFSCNNSFLTFKEIEDVFDSILYDVIKEFINGYPYLFEIRANRVSLVHDSLNTFLRQQKEPNEWVEKINRDVCSKLLSGDIEYMARLSSFRIDDDVICSILRQYSDFDTFERLLHSTVDYNSISSFYEQLRSLLEVRPGVIDIYQYYSFSLIYQVVTRNDLIGSEALIYQILNNIGAKEDIENHIFSSDIIWQIYLACIGQPERLERYMKNTMYGEGQLSDAYDSINEEITFFECMDGDTDALSVFKTVNSVVGDNLRKTKVLQKYLVYLWIEQKAELPFYTEFKSFIEDDNEALIYRALHDKYQFNTYDVNWVCYSARYRLNELGFFGDNNECRKGSIMEIIREKAPEGSFNVERAVLSFLRLANYEDRPVDISDINYVWCMYAQRKDYSVHTIDIALCVFERAGLINEADSADIICRLMQQSEKGIRHLLASYINLKGSDYVERLVNSGKFNDYESQLDCFELDPENISYLPKESVEKRLDDELWYYRNLDYIYGRQISNVLQSHYGKIICCALNKSDKKVMGGLDKDSISIIRKAGIEYIDNKNGDIEKEYIPFRDGCIGPDDFCYIRENNIPMLECARYTDGWYTCLPYVDLYEIFDINLVQEQYLSVIHQSLFARVINGEHIGDWKDIIGNVPYFLEKYGIVVQWKMLFYIFVRFLDLSLIYYPREVADQKIICNAEIRSDLSGGAN